MYVKVYWNLLILFGVSCQGIIDETSELLVRQKRVINLSGDQKEKIKDFPYMVIVKEYRRSNVCAGVILKQNIVLTAAKCVELEDQNYRIYSGNAQLGQGVHVPAHNIIGKRMIYGQHPFRSEDGIALMSVSPPFIYSINTRKIEFYERHNIIQPGSLGIVSGWGCNPTGHPGTAYPKFLRSITVPIISNQECATLYQHHFSISATDICTLHPTGQQYCTPNDAGAPLVIDDDYEHYLVGIHLFKGEVARRNNPEVFANLLHPSYKSKILENMRILGASEH